MSNSRPASLKLRPEKNAGDGADGKVAVRLGEALRENLRRRKAQQRARDDAPQAKPEREGKG